MTVRPGVFSVASVCVSLCPGWALTFEILDDLQTSFSNVRGYIFRTSTSGRVLRSWSQDQGQGHIGVTKYTDVGGSAFECYYLLSVCLSVLVGL